jgi:hypothetical protein
MVRTETSQGVDKRIFSILFKMKLRSAAFGYFGHMWELYAFGRSHRYYCKRMAYIHKLCLLFLHYLLIVGGLGLRGGGYLSKIWNTLPSLLLHCYCLAYVVSISVCISNQICQLVYAFFYSLRCRCLADSPLLSTLMAEKCSS